MGKIADIICRYFECDRYSKEKQVEITIIKLIEELIIQPKKIVSRTGDSVINYYNELRQNLVKLKGVK